MLKYDKFKWTAGVVVFIMCFGCLEGFSMVSEEELNQRLATIRTKNKGEGSDWGKLEAECLKLVQDHNSPVQKGQIYTTIAFIYSEKGYSSPNDVRIPKALEYSKKALEYPLEVTTACEMYSRWAGSLMVQYWERTEGEFVKIRQEAIVPCLTGLKLALDNKAPKKRQTLPIINLFDYDGPETDPVYQEMLKKHKEQVANYKKVKVQNELYMQRKVLTQRCISLYSHKPYATDELRRLAQEILKNHFDVVEELVTEVEAKIAQKE